jgi:hypothetical protein
MNASPTHRQPFEIELAHALLPLLEILARDMDEAYGDLLHQAGTDQQLRLRPRCRRRAHRRARLGAPHTRHPTLRKHPLVDPIPERRPSSRRAFLSVTCPSRP